jgi:hypothetical protein
MPKAHKSGPSEGRILFEHRVLATVRLDFASIRAKSHE